MHIALDAWTLARTPASPAQGLHHHGPRYFNFPYFCMTYGLENHGFVHKICPLLLSKLAVGMRKQPESVEVAPIME